MLLMKKQQQQQQLQQNANFVVNNFKKQYLRC